MPSKLPDNNVFDSPFRSTLNTGKAEKKKKSSKSKLSVVSPPKNEEPNAIEAEETFKATAYLSEPQWKAIHMEIHRQRMAGQRGNSANISRVIGKAIDLWIASEK